jgi:hypothetical protein
MAEGSVEYEESNFETMAPGSFLHYSMANDRQFAVSNLMRGIVSGGRGRIGWQRPDNIFFPDSFLSAIMRADGSMVFSEVQR